MQFTQGEGYDERCRRYPRVQTLLTACAWFGFPTSCIAVIRLVSDA
jgi:hypothetical protein